MATTRDDFLTAFPEFAAYGFAPAAIDFWLAFAQTFVNQEVWGPPNVTSPPYSPYDYGVLLYAAHNIAVAMQNASVTPITNPVTGAPMGAPGLTKGIESSKQVDKVSVSYDVGAIAEEAAGNWNATSYGRQFARLARQFGSIPRYIGAGSSGLAQPWAGPGFPFPGWFAW